MHVAVRKPSAMKQMAGFSVRIDTIMSPASRTDFVNLGSSSMGYACINKMPLVHTVFISSMDDSVRSPIPCYTSLANRIIALEGSVYDGMVA